MVAISPLLVASVFALPALALPGRMRSSSALISKRQGITFVDLVDTPDSCTNRCTNPTTDRETCPTIPSCGCGSDVAAYILDCSNCHVEVLGSSVFDVFQFALDDYNQACQDEGFEVALELNPIDDPTLPSSEPSAPPEEPSSAPPEVTSSAPPPLPDSSVSVPVVTPTPDPQVPPESSGVPSSTVRPTSSTIVRNNPTNAAGDPLQTGTGGSTDSSALRGFEVGIGSLIVGLTMMLL